MLTINLCEMQTIYNFFFVELEFTQPQIKIFFTFWNWISIWKYLVSADISYSSFDTPWFADFRLRFIGLLIRSTSFDAIKSFYSKDMADFSPKIVILILFWINSRTTLFLSLFFGQVSCFQLVFNYLLDILRKID